MATAELRIDLDALVANWRALGAMSDCETGAVVKADGYGLGAGRVARALAGAGCRRFFVAVAEEGEVLRQALGPAPEICVFSGHMTGDTELIADLRLTPMLNSLDQMTRHFETLPGHPFGLQLDTGMNRLGLEWEEWSAVAEMALAQRPALLMSHLACADEPDHPMNRYQLDLFRRMTDGTGVPRSLAATGGILLGPDYHFDLTRPGIGLYGGMPFAEARPVVTLDLPVVQLRELVADEVVGYGNAWQADRPTRIATLSGGYADGLHRALQGGALQGGALQGGLRLWHDGTPCPAVGRVSMDLITVDVTDLPGEPATLRILGPEQGVDALAEACGTIGYEVLTGLGRRYRRLYSGA